MPYIQPWKGSLRFRRRVPDHLVGLIGKREWVQSLGTKNRAEANRLVIPHIERTNEDIRDAEQDNWPRIDDGRLSDISGQWWQWHLEVRAKWLRLPVRLVESSIDGHTIAVTGDGELGDSLTRFISDRGLEVRPNSSAFARLKRECQILHHERTGGYYHEIGARQNATNKILDAIDNLEVEPQQVAALIEGTPVRPASATGRVASYRWPDLFGDWARETRAKEKTKYSWTKIVNKLTAHMGHDDAAAGAIIATIEDYAVVRGLVADLFSEGIEAMVSTTVRETVDAISALNKHEVSLGELAAKLGLDKSVVSRRLRQATELGYLINRETRSGRPARIALGDVLPDEVQVLPEPDQLAASPSVAVLHYGGEGIVDGIVSRDDPEGLTPAQERAPEQAAVEDPAGIEDIVPSQVAAERIQHWFDARRT